MEQQPPFTLSEFPSEKLEAFNIELKDLQERHSAHLVGRPFIDDEGKTRAQLMVFKKTPNIQEDGAPSAF